MLPGVVVNFDHQSLHFAFVGSLVSVESSVMMMYLVKVDVMSTNL